MHHLQDFGFEDLIELPKDLRNNFVKITDWRLERRNVQKRLKSTVHFVKKIVLDMNSTTY